MYFVAIARYENYLVVFVEQRSSYTYTAYTYIFSLDEACTQQSKFRKMLRDLSKPSTSMTALQGRIRQPIVEALRMHGN